MAKLVGVLVKMVKGEAPFDAAAVLTALTGAATTMTQKIDVDASVPRWQRQGRHNGLARRSGKTWPGFQAARSTNSRPITAAAVAAPAQDLEALEARSSARSAADLRRLPRDLSHQEGLVPDRWRLLGKLAVAALALGVVGAAAFWFLTMPTAPRAPPKSPRSGPATPTRGERIFHAGGCTSCHARPKSTGAAQLELAGGLELKTPFGTFVPPEHLVRSEGRHRRMVARRFRQRHAARRFARRPAFLSGLSLCVLCAHEAGRRRRPVRLS